MADVAGDICIHDDVGQIMLFALAGCSSSQTDTDDKMYGLIEMNNGNREIVCWRYDKVILVYTKDKVMSFLPSSQSTECPVSPHTSPFHEYKQPTPKYLEPISS